MRALQWVAFARHPDFAWEILQPGKAETGGHACRAWAVKAEPTPRAQRASRPTKWRCLANDRDITRSGGAVDTHFLKHRVDQFGFDLGLVCTGAGQ